jgi:hypothetical protein
MCQRKAYHGDTRDWTQSISALRGSPWRQPRTVTVRGTYHMHRKRPPRAQRCATLRAGPAVPEGACTSGLADSKPSLRRPDPGPPATPGRALSPAVRARRRPRRIHRHLTNGKALQASGADGYVPAVRRLVRPMPRPRAARRSRTRGHSGDDPEFGAESRDRPHAQH